MKSIKEIYKIGKGPSSSHTMGPYKAVSSYLENHPEALDMCDGDTEMLMDYFCDEGMYEDHKGNAFFRFNPHFVGFHFALKTFQSKR